MSPIVDVNMSDVSEEKPKDNTPLLTLEGRLELTYAQVEKEKLPLKLLVI